MTSTSRRVTTDRGDAGIRLDLVLRRHLADVPAATRTRVQSWIESGRVSVNGATVRRVSGRAALGDVLAVVLPAAVRGRTSRAVMTAEPIDLDILYEDDDLIALNKPAGMVMHPTYGHPDGTVMNALLWHARSWPAPQRPSLVQRLDKLTSGIAIVAKTKAVHAALQRTLASGRSAKDYLAVAYGRVGVARGVIDLRLGRDRHDRRRVVASATEGAPSRTAFERIDRVAAPRVGIALLRCRLLTGRMHQIRVHLAARGWPLVGDPTYGEPRWSAIDDQDLAAALRDFPRQALHSWRVGLTHPTTRARLVLQAPPPRDFQDLLGTCGFRTLSTTKVGQ
ncbi:MAG: hypothetical protein A3H97_21530 [Acidobacteria bacterium RIFCSPLOWO2_02_FULL_65_29]|nr:MAG: hypothetical protein A3H97_21530 [Acidobacteria bacterium RIFCSPLOWO2_02_FULL_65_29]